MTPVPERSGPTGLVANLLIALLCLVWGSTWIVIRGGLADLPPYTSAAVRFVVSGLAMSALVAFAGLVLLFLTDLRQFGPEGVPAALLLFVSPLVSALGSTLVKRHGQGVQSLALNRNAMLLGAAVLSLLALLLERHASVRWTPAAIGSVLYLSLAGTVLTFGLYFWLLRSVPAHRMSLIAYVTPAIALTLGAVVGDEPLTPWTVGGAACILAGVVLVARGHRH